MEYSNSQHSVPIPPPLYQYFCFPIYGLQCEDTDTPEEFLFTDATILSGKQVRLLYSAPDKNLPFFLKDAVQYVVVRCPLHEHCVEQKRHLEVVLERAKVVVAGISIPLLAYSHFRSCPTLATEVHGSVTNTMIHLSSKGVSVTNEHVQALPIATPEYMFSRGEFLDLLNREPYRWLSDVLLFSSTTNQLQRAIRRAASALYVGINQPTPTFQFFGCWVSLEVLLNYGEHKKIMSRAELLLGEQVYEDFSAASSVTIDTVSGEREQRPVKLSVLRNKLVHGADTATMENVFYIVRFVTNTLLAASYYSSEFETKNQLCEHLDFVSQIRSQAPERDKFEIAKQWAVMWTDRCLWDYNFAHLVYFFGLYKLDVEEEAFRVNCASALTVLREIRGFEPTIGFGGLANSMYTKQMPFRDVEEAWEYIAIHRDQINPTLAWFR